MKYCTLCKAKYEDSVTFCSIDGEVLEADPAAIVNTVLDGQYQMEALLGKGGMGAVYRARHILLGDRVAIKVLPPEVRTNAEWLRRFRREGQAARRFRHPNSVTVYDLRTAADGTIYMVMEYVEGHTLDLAIKTRGRFPAAEALDILTPIMSVLDTAHSMGVVHRDLKPENIMIGKPDETGQPVVKLLDLGIAKMREIAGGDNGGNTALTMAGQVLGTPYYMSPEQWGEIPRDQSSEIDGRADIYSLGLVFYEMIAGRRCFAGNTLHELRREHVQTRPRPLVEVVPDVPRGFSDAIERATAKDRGDRQPSAGTLASELRAGLSTPSGAVNAQPAVLTETVIGDSRETNADVNAPTILTVDAPATSPASGRAASTHDATVYEPAKPQPAVAATVVESATHAETVTVPHVPKPAPPPPVAVTAPGASKSKVGLLIGVVVVFVILLVGGIGGFLVWNKMKSNSTSTSTNANTTGVASVPVEVSRYWLSLEPKGKPKTRVAGLVPVASGQEFRFYFTFAEDGYLYIVGPGPDKNQPIAFLTTKPASGSGVTSNKVSKEVEFSFPRDDKDNVHTITLDASSGTDHFTVIFAKAPLSSPSFLNDPVTGDPLTAAQQAELKDFVSRYQSKAPTTELDESNASAPFVRVKAMSDQTSNPIVFNIRIQHN
ncbi:MAG TPA: serine/threonine-protein kinase [Pyrinomonadaceae bacterium]|nr:serine/threonine-protein kinase [Pyrinomonadaceae bacterium]